MITPLLEKYILEGKAIFKNTSIGENGLLALEIPRGSTAIITKIICEPFLNIWDATNVWALNTYLTSLNIDQSNFASINQALLRRCEYNLKIYAESGKVKLNYNLRQEIEVDFYEVKTQNNVNHDYFPMIKPKYNVRELDCFILANETIFFMYTFPDWVGGALIGDVDQFGNTFNNITPVPPFPNGPDFADPMLYQYSCGTANAEVYFPMGKQNTIPTWAGETTKEINRFFDPLFQWGLRVPNFPGAPITEEMNYSLPLLNIEYVLINSGLGSLFNPGNEGI